jgi:predicted Zn-dependent peptidase
MIRRDVDANRHRAKIASQVAMLRLGMQAPRRYSPAQCSKMEALRRRMGTLSRRQILGSLMAAGLSGARPRTGRADIRLAEFTLENGLRVHCAPTPSHYVAAALTLRSREIPGAGGLGHIMEHTSFTGAAGALSSREVNSLHKAYLHDSNATTSPGLIQWQAGFLPARAAEALHLLALTSLDQKFDVETVASEARIVLQELYLDKYDSERIVKKQFDAALYGENHPYAKDTTEAEIAKAKTPPEQLAAELRAFAGGIRLPGNMDLFLVGDLEMDVIEPLVRKAFGPFPGANGPLLDVPIVGVTRSHHGFNGTSQQLKRPLSEVRIGWNTGVRMVDPDVTVLVALGLYLDDLITKELREKKGDTYSPEVSYKPDRCSGIFSVKVTSSKAAAEVERDILRVVGSIKESVDAAEIANFKDRLAFTRYKAADSNDSVLTCMLSRLLEGGTVEDCNIADLTAAEVQTAAVRYLPSHKGGYVCARLHGS